MGDEAPLHEQNMEGMLTNNNKKLFFFFFFLVISLNLAFSLRSFLFCF